MRRPGRLTALVQGRWARRRRRGGAPYASCTAPSAPRRRCPGPQLPAALRVEPLHLAAGGVVSLAAGSRLPETSVSVVNGAGVKITRALIGGARQALHVVRPAGCGRRPASQAPWNRCV